MEEIEPLQALAGQELVDTLFDDHAALAGRHSVLISMDGYLKFLKRTMDARAANLICINKTLPIEWFAPSDESEEFIHAYAQMACRDRDRIRRVTVLQRPDDLRNQFHASLERLPRDQTESGQKQRYVWMMSLALAALAVEEKFDDKLQEKKVLDDFLKLIGGSVSLGLREASRQVYPSGGGSGEIKLPQHVALDAWTTYPESQPPVDAYLRPLIDGDSDAPQIAGAWSKCINRSYFELLGETGAYWGTRDVVGNWLNETSMGQHLGRSSEIGAFQLDEQRKLAFHALGDLSSGVRITFIEKAEQALSALNDLFRKINDQRNRGAHTVGIIGVTDVV